MEYIFKYLFTETTLVSDALSFITIIIPIISAWFGFRKQHKASINQEKLNYVYYSLIDCTNNLGNDIASIKEFISYLDLRLKSSKYTTLLDSTTIINYYNILKAELESHALNTDYITFIYREIKNKISINFEKIKSRSGYKSNLNSVVRTIFIISYLLILLSSFLLNWKKTYNSITLQLITIFSIFIALILLFINSIISLFLVFNQKSSKFSKLLCFAKYSLLNIKFFSRKATKSRK